MKPSEPGVSIVIPCYNSGRGLLETVDSARSQRWARTEIIVVDDGSTDPETLRVLAELPAEVRVIKQENAGPSAARNRGISVATGDYILPLDADDLIDSRYIAAAVGILQTQPQVGIVYCRGELFGRASGPWDLPDWSLDLMLLGNIIFVSSVFRRADWERVGGFPEDMRSGGEDWAFWLRIISLGRSVHQFPDRWFRYRIRGVETTSFHVHDYAAVHARVFRENLPLFTDHVEVLFEHFFGLQRQIDKTRGDGGLRHRLGRWLKSVRQPA